MSDLIEENRSNAREAGQNDVIEGELMTADPPGVMEMPSIGRELTRNERSLLRILMDPQYFSAKTAERANAAGIGSTTYFCIMKKPDFQPLLVLAYRMALRESIGDVLQASIDTARESGRDGQRDRQMILEMTGMHTPRQQIDVNVSSPIIGVIGVAVADV